MGYEVFAIALDVVVLLALIGTAVYALTLNRSLRRLREDKGQLAKLTEDLNGAVMRSESAIQGLRGTAQEVNQDFLSAREGAQNTLDELKLITDAAERMAERIERATTGGLQARAAEPNVNADFPDDTRPRVRANAAPFAQPAFDARDHVKERKRDGADEAMGNLLRSAVAAAQRDPEHGGDTATGQDGGVGKYAERKFSAGTPQYKDKGSAVHGSWGFANAISANSAEPGPRPSSTGGNGDLPSAKVAANTANVQPGRSKAEQELLAAMQALSNVSAKEA